VGRVKSPCLSSGNRLVPFDFMKHENYPLGV
jgi:hypothetical protein